MEAAEPWVAGLGFFGGGLVGTGIVTVATGRLGGWYMMTVAHALVHGIRGTFGNRLFRLYVGQEWLSPAALSREQKRKRKRKYCTELPHSSVSVSLSAFNILWFDIKGIIRLYSNLGPEGDVQS